MLYSVNTITALVSLNYTHISATTPTDPPPYPLQQQQIYRVPAAASTSKSLSFICCILADNLILYYLTFTFLSLSLLLCFCFTIVIFRRCCKCSRGCDCYVVINR